MLRGVPFEISPKLLRILAEMGHGDRICIGDEYFAASTMAERGRLVYSKGIGAVELIDAILKLMPLDNWSDYSVVFMGKDDGNGRLESTPMTDRMTAKIREYDENAADSAQFVGRFEFYDLAKKCYAVIGSGETENYGCVILQKGVK